MAAGDVWDVRRSSCSYLDARESDSGLKLDTSALLSSAFPASLPLCCDSALPELRSGLSLFQDICEDISDHVEQIHALLETEFTLKLLSYSVNIIVDIR